MWDTPARPWRQYGTGSRAGKSMVCVPAAICQPLPARPAPHLGQTMGALRMPRRQRHIVEQAIAQRAVSCGVVPRGPTDAEGSGAG